VLAQDLFHLVLEHQLVQLDLLFLDFVVLGEEGFVVQLLEAPLVLLVLSVQAAELVIGLDQLLLQEIVAVRHLSLLSLNSMDP
jgi:hypothetical protein